MEALLHSAARSLDAARSLVLRLVLQPPLQPLYRDRAKRLTLLFTLALTLNLLLSVAFPLWVLVVGPILYGYPHLFASLRYTHRALLTEARAKPHRESRRFGFFFFLLALLGLYRVFTVLGYLKPLAEESIPYLPEMLSLFLSFVFLSRLYPRKPATVLQGSFLLAPLLWLGWQFPLAFNGALLLFHNLGGFLFWIRIAPEGPEKRLAVSATLAFLGATALIFLGAFDGLYQWWLPAGELPWAGLDSLSLGLDILPWNSGPLLAFHAVVAYAFGQSLHYFVWMKALPDEAHSHPAPTTFRQSSRLLADEFGPALTRVVLVSVLGGLALWGLLTLPKARLVYFALATYHNYFELAGLALLLAPLGVKMNGTNTSRL